MTVVSPHPFRHALETLRLGELLDLVAARCVGDAARRAIRSLEPTADRVAIGTSLEQIDEVRRLREEAGDVPVADVPYVAALEALVERGELLDGLSLLAVAAGERAAADLSRMLRTHGTDCPRLAVLGAGIVPDAALVKAIDKAIDTDGSVRDGASAELRKIRRDIHALRGDLRQLSEKMVSNYGEGALATVMGSRHVLVVPRQQARRENGLVHSTSASGGSLYFEPARLMQMNNDLETRGADEAAEVARILSMLAQQVREGAERILENAGALVAFDALRARATFAREFHCTAPALSSGRVHLLQARHPLLLRVMETTGRTDALVPLDLSVDTGQRLMVITGPNAGGKTVALETLGLCALMLQCGLHVPCGEGSELPVFDRIFVDIGDEQSIESSLSTFTSHLRNLDEMVRGAGPGTLCLVDEIGDGTDPDEGAALAVATLERLLESGSAVVATTHYGRIKTWALSTDGVENASMAFDEDDGRPLYRLLQGVAGRSRGIETARRTGFDAEVVARAEAQMGADAFRLDAVLSGLEAQKLSLEREIAAAERERVQLAARMAEAQEKVAAYDLTKKQAERKAVREAEALLADARREVEQVVRTIRERGAEKEAIRESRERIAGKLEQIKERTAAAAAAAPGERPRPERVHPGDRVSMNPTGEPAGVVESVKGKRAVIEIRGKRFTLPVDQLFTAADAGGKPGEAVTYEVQFEPLTSTSLDVRGRDREEALGELARFLDQAVLSGVQEISIIHGVGEGVLLRAVRDHLQGDHRVTSVRQGQQAEGGMGVTIAALS